MNNVWFIFFLGIFWVKIQPGNFDYVENGDYMSCLLVFTKPFTPYNFFMESNADIDPRTVQPADPNIGEQFEVSGDSVGSYYKEEVEISDGKECLHSSPWGDISIDIVAGQGPTSLINLTITPLDEINPLKPIEIFVKFLWREPLDEIELYEVNYNGDSWKIQFDGMPGNLPFRIYYNIPGHIDESIANQGSNGRKEGMDYIHFNLSPKVDKLEAGSSISLTYHIVDWGGTKIRYANQ